VLQKKKKKKMRKYCLSVAAILGIAIISLGLVGIVFIVTPTTSPQKFTYDLGVELRPLGASLSSTYQKNNFFGAAKCIDGNTEGPDEGVEDGASADFCHTENEPTPWLAIDYGTTVTVQRVEIFNRRQCCADRTRNVDVRISDVLPTSGSQMFSGGTLLGRFVGPGSAGQRITISGQSMSGRFVIVQMDNGHDALNLKEVKAFGQSVGSCKCGIKTTTRIAGGSETEVNEYPWIAAFYSNGDFKCAATLVANNWAVTASHCFYRNGVLAVTKDTMSLVLGVHDRTGNTDTNRKVLRIEEIVFHPSYFPDYPCWSNQSFDIALLKISESVDLDAWSPACLPTPGADFTGQNGWLYGWGITSEDDENLAEKLLEVEVPIVSDAVCASAMSGINPNCPSLLQKFTSDMLCAGGENEGSCVGDSGGPLTVANPTSGAHTLVGAVSWGAKCATEGQYGVLADVPFFRTWIDETIAAKGGATFCS